MSLLHFDPYSPTKIQKDMNRILRRFWKDEPESSYLLETTAWIPPLDLKEEQDRFVVLLDVPGVDPNKIEISAADNILTVKGERMVENKTEQEGYIREERIKGSFFRSFTLPTNVDSERITARSHAGVLEIEIPKKEQAKGHRITVNVEEEKYTLEKKEKGNKSNKEQEKTP